MHPEIPDSGSAAARPNPPRRRVGLSPAREERLKQQLRKTTCSEPWIDAQFVSLADRPHDGGTIVYRYHDPKVYPPGGRDTAMIRCSICGVFNPPNAMENGQCLDHARHEGYGPSPSAIAIQALQFYHVKLQEAAALPSENVRALRKEIKRFMKKRAKKRSKSGIRKRSRHKE